MPSSQAPPAPPHHTKFTHCFLRVLVCMYPLHSCTDRRERCPVMSQCVLPTLSLSTLFAFNLTSLSLITLKWMNSLFGVCAKTHQIKAEVLRLFWMGTVKGKKPTVRDRLSHSHLNHIKVQTWNLTLQPSWERSLCVAKLCIEKVERKRTWEKRWKKRQKNI